MKKKGLALMLAAMLCVLALAGCGADSGGAGEKEASGEAPKTEEAAPAEDTAEETGSEAAAEKTYDEHISFTATTSYSFDYSASGYDYEADPIYQFVTDKFNMDMELQACPSQESTEKITMWIVNDTMPDVILWPGWNIQEYRTYVDQGMLGALPDGWKEKWPNLAKMVRVSGLEDYLTIDGKIYALPNAIFCNFIEVQENLSSHSSLYFRKDWAEQVGMAGLGEDGTITMSELKEYLEKVKEAGLAEVPLAANSTTEMFFMFHRFLGVNTGDFVETPDGFVFNMADEKYTEPIKAAQEWYQEGLMDPDFYLQNDPLAYYNEMFDSSRLAAYYSGGTVGGVTGRMARDGGLLDYIGFAQPKAEDGKVYSTPSANYWRFNVFSPNTDEATLERILDVIDYFATPEGQLVIYRGVPGTDWVFTDDGAGVEQLNQEVVTNDEGAFAWADRYNIFYGFGINGDDIDLSPYSPHLPEAVSIAQKGYDIRNSGVIWPIEWNYNFFSGDSRANYSMPAGDKKTEIVVNNEDVDSTWASFLEEYQGIWQPLLDDLNAEYYPQ